MNVILMPAAQDDLRALYAYYAEGNPVAADRVLGAILKAANGLGVFPLMGRACVVSSGLWHPARRSSRARWS